MKFSKIFIVGHPSKVGGADTELDQQIHVWQALGLEVHIVHTGQIDQNLKSMRMEERGVIYHEPLKWEELKGEVVISYCNGVFLKEIEEIRKYARVILWVNCMTWLFPLEKIAHKKGLIDWFIYQTDHAREKVQDTLIEINPNFKWHKVKPYFHSDDFPFVPLRPDDKFRFGRISRADADKFNNMSLWIYDTMCAPNLKEGIILGINDKIRHKIGNPPNWIKCYDAGAISAQEVYWRSNCIIQSCDTYENYPRVAFEAMSSGSLLIVDDRGGWREQIMHGQTGWLCKNEREFVYYATRAAFERQERRLMIEAAHEQLEKNWGMEAAKKEWGDFFTRVENSL